MEQPILLAASIIYILILFIAGYIEESTKELTFIGEVICVTAIAPAALALSLVHLIEPGLMLTRNTFRSIVYKNP